MGLPAQDLLQRRRVQDAAAGLVPVPAQRRARRRLAAGRVRRRLSVPTGAAPGGMTDQGLHFFFL